MLMPCGCTLTAVADAPMSVGEMEMPCAHENDSVNDDHQQRTSALSTVYCYAMLSLC